MDPTMDGRTDLHRPELVAVDDVDGTAVRVDDRGHAVGEGEDERVDAHVAVHGLDDVDHARHLGPAQQATGGAPQVSLLHIKRTRSVVLADPCVLASAKQHDDTMTR